MANQVQFRFHGDLNELLSVVREQETFWRPFSGAVSIKHLIESLGVPHTEVEAITANGRSVDFCYIAQDGDCIDVYPPTLPLPTDDLVRLRPPLPHPPRFLLDNHLGRLARYLRLLGFDALYFNNKYDDAQLAQLAYDQERVLLTRDRGLLMRRLVVYGYCLRTRNSTAQLTAVLRRYQLYDAIRPWERCLRCNGRLAPVDKAKILHRLEPKTKRYFHEFQMCRDCAQIYWKGSHYQALANFVQTFDR